MLGTPKSWTEADLLELIGQSESIRREFKSGRMFDEEPEQKWIPKISKEISALANTEGGDLFLGIDEDRKSKPKVATKIDGAPVTLAPERLQQLIEGNVSPYLPGIRVQRVLLSGQTNRAVFVVRVPAGSTAYQANDKRYYGRSEFEVIPLPDHEIRLRMSRGKVARGIVLARIAVDLGVARASQERARAEAKINEDKLRDAKGEPVELEFGRFSDFGHTPEDVLKSLSGRILPDTVTCDFVFRNDGELSIRAPVVEFQETRNMRLFDEGLVRRFGSINGFGSVTGRLKLKEAIVYPGDEQILDVARLLLECRPETVLASGDYTVSWKVFLDNSPPTFGEIDLASLIEDARRRVSPGAD